MEAFVTTVERLLRDLDRPEISAVQAHSFAQFNEVKFKADIDRFAEAIKKETTKLAVACKPPAKKEDVTSCISSLESATMGISIIAGSVPLSRGRFLVQAVQAALRKVLDSLLPLAHAAEKLMTDGNNKSYLVAVGIVWQQCDEAKKCPSNATGAISLRIKDMDAALQDAIEELDTIISRADRDLEKEKENLSNGEKDDFDDDDDDDDDDFDDFDNDDDLDEDFKALDLNQARRERIESATESQVETESQAHSQSTSSNNQKRKRVPATKKETENMKTGKALLQMIRMLLKKLQLRVVHGSDISSELKVELLDNLCARTEGILALTDDTVYELRPSQDERALETLVLSLQDISSSLVQISSGIVTQEHAAWFQTWLEQFKKQSAPLINSTAPR